MKNTKTYFTCDLCAAELPDDYVSTDGEGYRYFARNAYDEVPLMEPVAGCNSLVVHVVVGGKHEPSSFSDLCDTCRLRLLRQAVHVLEQKVGADNA